MTPAKQVRFTVCPHDCPSTCALEVETRDGTTVERVRGAKDNSYTLGVICSKVARYSERIHHPHRLTRPLRRRGPKGSDDFEPIDWDTALDMVADRFLREERRLGPEAVWPYFFAGTMGLVMRDGIDRLRHAKRYSGLHKTICTTLPKTGYVAGTGKLAGVDPREMQDSDLIFLWGTNAAATQVNVMTHVLEARRKRGARIVVVDVYENATARQADVFLCVKPGTDAALACAIMHVLFRDGLADREYLAKYTDRPAEFEAHLASRSPGWASAICGVPAADIEAIAREIGRTPRTYFRLGYGFTRQRNGVVGMHAALSIAAVAGAWQHQGGGAFYNNGDIYHWDATLIQGLDVRDPTVRSLDMSRVGAVLTGDRRDLGDGPPVTAMLVQNTNPLMVAPDTNRVRAGFERDDLFVCVHEQFMTETARMADVVLPATMFMEHDDFYQSGGHQHILFGPKIVEAPGECRSNHEVICGLARRLGAEHPGFEMTPRELIDRTLEASGWGRLHELERERWIDCQPDFRTAHYLDGFAWPDGKFRFAPDWQGLGPAGFGPELGHRPSDAAPPIPEFPDYWASIEEANDAMPFRLVPAPARHFLNSSFTETATSKRRQKAPVALMHPEDMRRLGIVEGTQLKMGNERGEVRLPAREFEGLLPGVVVVESVWPNEAFEGGIGINALTGADPAAPIGGAVFHDNRVWIEPSRS